MEYFTNNKKGQKNLKGCSFIMKTTQTKKDRNHLNLFRKLAQKTIKEKGLTERHVRNKLGNARYE